MQRGQPVIRIALPLVVLASAVASGQWLKYPDRDVPRLPDGRPNMSAPAPRKQDGSPDFSGVWRWNPGRYGTDVTLDLKSEEIQSWARTLTEQRLESLAKDDPANMKCLPQGPRSDLAPFHLAKFIQQPGLIVIVYENMSFRQVFMDGRELPSDPNPSWMGYSVGRWDSDTLVIDTAGFTNRSWLDFVGHPHSEALRTTERLRRTSFGRLEMTTTFADPQVYARPWTVTTGGELVPDTDLLEYVCENERSSEHMIGKASDGVDSGAGKTVPVEVLSRYVGVYEYRFPDSPNTLRRAEVSLKERDLYLEDRRLLPLSDSTFAVLRGQASRVDFIQLPDGRIDELRVRRPGGCGGSSGVAMSIVCGATPDELIATRRTP